MKHENSAGVIIFYQDEEPYFLLLKYPTYWGFAKGWIEPGEDAQDAAIRETKEEAGILVNLIPGFKKEQRWFYMNKEKEKVSKHAVFFLAEISENEAEKVKISFEHEGFAWLSFEEAMKKLKIRNNREMLKKAYELILELE